MPPIEKSKSPAATCLKKYPTYHCACAADPTKQRNRAHLNLEEAGYPTKEDSRKLTQAELDAVRTYLRLQPNKSCLVKFRDFVCRWPRPSELLAMFRNEARHVIIIKHTVEVSAEKPSKMRQVVSEFVGKHGQKINEFTQEHKLIFVWNKKVADKAYDVVRFEFYYFSDTDMPDIKKHDKINNVMKKAFKDAAVEPKAVQVRLADLPTETSLRAGVPSPAKKLVYDVANYSTP